MATRQYIELMNARYQRILDTAWDGATLDVQYDGQDWIATLEARPSPTRNRFIHGSGVTLEYALADLEKTLGLERWTG